MSAADWSGPEFLDSAARADWPEVATLWRASTLGSGEVLFRAGQRGSRMAYVVSGNLAITAAGLPREVVGPGGIVGSLAAFFPDAIHLSTASADGPASLQLLDAAALRRLRTLGSPSYRGLLDATLHRVAARLRLAAERLEAIRPGTFPAPAPVPLSRLSRLWRAVSGPARTRCPPLLPLLARHPGLEHVAPSTLELLAAAFVAEPLDDGQVIAVEGAPADCCWILAEGQVEVVRAGAGDQASHLATLLPGQMIGINALVEESPRTATCVVTAPGWVYRLDRTTFSAMTGDARVPWHEAVLTSLVEQLYRNHALIHRLVHPLAPTTGLDTPPRFLMHGDVA